MGQILECVLKVEGEVHRFIFEGDVEIGNEISFNNLEVKEVKADTVVPFEITAKTWPGYELTPDDAIGDVLSQYTRGVIDFHLISMYEPLKAYLDELKNDCIIVGDLEFPKKIVYDAFLDEYDLIYVTDQYTYYSDCFDSYLMLDTDTRYSIAIGCFAYSGYEDSVENVTSGKEKLLYYSEELLSTSQSKETRADLSKRA